MNRHKHAGREETREVWDNSPIFGSFFTSLARSIEICRKVQLNKKPLTEKTEVTVLIHLFGNLDISTMLLEKINTVTMFSYQTKTE